MWLRVGTLLDGTSDMPTRDVHVVYNADAILFVGTGGQTPPGELLRAGQTAPDAHAPDYTLLPTLIDAHAHLFLAGGEIDAEQRATNLRKPPDQLLSEARARLAPLVHLGIGGVRDAGDRAGVGLALSRLDRLAPADGRPLMPYVESPGSAIHHRGRYGAFMADALEDYASPHECVAARVAAGADRIKLIATGIIDFQKGRVTSQPQMSVEEIAELADAARSFGRQTFAHASGDDGIDRVIDGGVDSIEHGYFVRDDQLARMRDARIAWVPTFAPVQAQVDHAATMGWDVRAVANLKELLRRHADSLASAHAMGVIIVAGSDAGSYGVPHGDGLLRELELMEAAGMSPVAVINSATGGGMLRFDYREKLGRIATGYRSRFILTRHRPELAVASLRQPRLVVFDGAVHHSVNGMADAAL